MLEEIGGAPVIAALAGGWLAAGAVIEWWSATIGLLIAMIVAVSTALAVMRKWTLRMQRAYTHGWHAGWHDAHQGRDGEECWSYPCPIVDLADERTQRLNQLTG